ncbi:hypothetical protein [Cryptosporangium aurantiacum]|uniref:Uncharacterized protein n=1 Tax=Cryptosporangium aurantiacum TaxID=134849 RepID=A0A1M7I800_9ACTN|nr:hypothetical protein [Cryptosporangium aurantiacum]SHM36557.1 hypothetical protein SAMN05443668_101411 [Cryptosporangium aurantiacum]
MTSKARALARAAREAEAERLRIEAERRARRRAILTAPWRAARAIVPRRRPEPHRRGLFGRGRTGKIRAARRDRAQLAAIATGLIVLLLVVWVTIDSWAMRIGATVLALLLTPVLLALTRSDYSRSVHRS